MCKFEGLLPLPKKAEELATITVGRLTEPGLHFVGGVAGLILQVLPSGGRSWILRLSVAGKRRDMGLGGFPDVTLAGARDAARAARAKANAGIDPIDERDSARQMLKLAKANAVSFRDAATKYIDTHEAGWTNAKHSQQWRNSLKNYAYPVIGDIMVSEIGLPQLLTVLEPIWRAKTETATRVRARIEAVLGWATTKGYRQGLNPARWKGHLENILPAAGKIMNEVPQPALPFDEAGAFMQALRAHQGSGARALEFLILTAVRSAEVRGALWSEIDADDGVWTIPAVRMKMKKEHKVPLSTRALELLEALPREGSPLLFPAPRDGILSGGTLNAVIRRMNASGGKQWVDPKSNRTAVAHGFRSTFRDWASERSNFPPHVAEMALAHSIGDKVEAAYRRGELLKKRRSMMNEWAAFLAKPEPNAKIIPMQKSKQA